jgi:hypothetical protein
MLSIPDRVDLSAMACVVRRGGVQRIIPFVLGLTLTLNAQSVLAQTKYDLSGVVWIGPSCAGAQREGENCRARLSDVAVRLYDKDRRIVASTITDASGAFVISGEAGQYQLRAVGQSKLMRCLDISVTLPTKNPIPVSLECDSGMR